ncbi:MAG TPA: hypothetical protein VEZ46_08505 [Mycobacteriales bacterium]|nr:hypothetical protein [Mycobacteriales bacterium]
MSPPPPTDPPANLWSVAAHRRAAADARPARARTPAATLPHALGALAAGVVAAVAVPGAPPGLGLALTVVAVAAALTPALRSRLDRHTVGFGTAAVVLAGTAAVRTPSGWWRSTCSLPSPSARWQSPVVSRGPRLRAARLPWRSARRWERHTWVGRWPA